MGFSTSEIQDILDSPHVALDRSDSDRAAILQAYRKGFRYIFIVGAALAAFAWVAAFLLMPEISLDRADDKKLKEEARSGVVGNEEKLTAGEVVKTPEDSN